MSRRHDTLIPLTHDHHHALAQARRLEEVASLDAWVEDVKRGLSGHDVDPDVLRRISSTLTDHVRFEEGELLPLVERLLPEDQLRALAEGRREV